MTVSTESNIWKHRNKQIYGSGYRGVGANVINRDSGMKGEDPGKQLVGGTLGER